MQRRFAMSTMPGAWECTASARFGSPIRPPRMVHGQSDVIEYEKVPFPTLVIAGGNDKLRLPSYGEEIVRRIPDAQLLVFDKCGHCPNIEQADRFNEAVIAFLARN